MSEKPVHSRLRRLVDWINLTGAKKVHSLIDKVYKRKNLEMAWEKVKANRGRNRSVRCCGLAPTRLWAHCITVLRPFGREGPYKWKPLSQLIDSSRRL
jgi:hypothetical protein